MLDPKGFLKHVIRPTLFHLELWSKEAELLVLGSALVESDLRWLKQKRGGPAIGLYQIEKATHNDLWKSYLNKEKNTNLKARVIWLTSRMPLEEQLIHNLAYATAMARVLYWRRPESLPEVGDVNGLAGYWKDYYNTRLGKGKVNDFVNKITPFL